jgi:transcriptional regulator with XRE-family HTH domain
MSDRAGEDARGLAALGAAIRTLRDRAGLSGDELAERAEVDPPLLAEVEAGRRQPTWGDLRRIAHGLQTPLEKLFELAERLEDEPDPQGPSPRK